MKRVFLAILAVLISTSAFADANDRGRDHGRHDQYGRHDGHPGFPNHGHRPDPHPYPRPRPPVFIPPVIIPPVVAYPQVQIIHCASRSYQPNLCYTGMRYVQRLDIVRQYSNSPCIPGATARLQGNAILVLNGCEADFRVQGNY